jgi:uncharacterized protein
VSTVHTTVVDVPERRRYEALDVEADDRLAGFAEYIHTDSLITFTHTEVQPAYEGQGVGSTLVRAALDDARSRGLSVLPVCPFFRGWIQLHPEYADLVYDKRTAHGS